MLTAYQWTILGAVYYTFYHCEVPTPAATDATQQANDLRFYIVFRKMWILVHLCYNCCCDVYYHLF